MFTADEFLEVLSQMGISHVVGLPDSTIGDWFMAVDSVAQIQRIAVCREGEAWAIAAGLQIGGAYPLVLMQCTGLFESGDSLRNAIFDYDVPLFGVVGYRSYLNQAMLTGDTARTFTEPILTAWGLDYVLIDSHESKSKLAEHYRWCRNRERAGIVLVAEGGA